LSNIWYLCTFLLKCDGNMKQGWLHNKLSVCFVLISGIYQNICNRCREQCFHCIVKVSSLNNTCGQKSVGIFVTAKKWIRMYAWIDTLSQLFTICRQWEGLGRLSLSIKRTWLLRDDAIELAEILVVLVLCSSLTELPMFKIVCQTSHLSKLMLYHISFRAPSSVCCGEVWNNEMVWVNL